MSLERLLVVVDGSTNSARALAWAIELAEATDAEVVAVHAVGLLVHGGDDEGAPVGEGRRGEVRRRFEVEWCAPLRDAGVAFRALLLDGDPVIALTAGGRGRRCGRGHRREQGHGYRRAARMASNGDALIRGPTVCPARSVISAHRRWTRTPLSRFTGRRHHGTRRPVIRPGTRRRTCGFSPRAHGCTPSPSRRSKTGPS